MKHIPLMDLQRQVAGMRDELDAAMRGVIDTTSYILGPALAAFEADFARYCGIRHCIGVATGLDALRLSLEICGIGRGDEVILPANTFIATALAVTKSGATPVLVDADPATDLINLEQVRKCINKKTRVLMPVHLYGRLADMDAVQALAAEFGLRVIEDAAQAHGAERGGKKAGTHGITGCFSFYPGKNLGAFGDGGAITTQDDALAEKLRAHRNYGSSKKYYHQTCGENSRLDTLQAAILGVKLKHLDTWNEKRRGWAQEYHKRLSSVKGLVLPGLVTDKSHVHHIFPVKVAPEQRDPLLTHLQSQGIGASIHYPLPIHQQEAYKNTPLAGGRFPVTEDHSRRMISLPMFPELTHEELEYICKTVIDFLKP